MGDPSSRRGTQVFLSYASQDKEFARKIANRIKAHGVRVWLDELELAWGDSIVEKINSAISSSDYIIFLVSPNSVKSEWCRDELTTALARDLTERDVSIMPVLISDLRDSEIPIALKNIKWLDLRKNYERNIDLLVKRITNAPKIDFSYMDAKTFEKLACDLLKNLGFTNIQYQAQVGMWRPDIKAEYLLKDPFGVETSEVWLVETKFYKKERASLRSLYQMMNYFLAFPGRYNKILLITNSQLTSAAKDWLFWTFQKEHRVQIRVIEGPELKNLLLGFPRLIQEYFAATQKEGD